MVELLPIVLGTILGAVIYRHTRGRTRLVLSVAAVIVSGTAATVLSGEYAESWIYVLFDLGLAALGLAIGFAVGQFAGSYKSIVAQVCALRSTVTAPAESRQ